MGDIIKEVKDHDSALKAKESKQMQLKMIKHLKTSMDEPVGRNRPVIKSSRTIGESYVAVAPTPKVSGTTPVIR